MPYYLGPGFAVPPGWVTVGGTSLSSPIVASLFALVGGAHGVEDPAATLYSHLGGASLYDVTEGGDGKCDDVYGSGCEGSLSSALDCGEGELICNAGPGYDGPSGVGAPTNLAAFEAGSESGHAERVATREVAAKKAEEEQQAAERKAAEERRAAEQKAAEERKPEEERRAAEAKKASEERQAAEQKAAAERRAAEERKAAEVKLAAEVNTTEELLVVEASRALEQHDAEELKRATEAQQRQAAETKRVTGGGAGGGTVVLSGLALTARASAAVAHGLPTVAQVAFAFDLSGPARVRVTLARLLTAHGRTRQVAATGALTLAAAGGRDSARLRGSATLAPGSYRLTLAPVQGAARSIVLSVRASAKG